MGGGEESPSGLRSVHGAVRLATAPWTRTFRGSRRARRRNRSIRLGVDMRRVATGSTWLLGSWVVLAGLLCPAFAHANGAFPDSLGLLLPRDRPHQILLTTNFGLLRSDDDGQHWEWVCEEAIGYGGFLYQIGAPPGDRLFAVTSDGLRVSDDTGCSWRSAAGVVSASDVWPDFTDEDRVLAIGQALDPAVNRSASAVYTSRDGGDTFEELLGATFGKHLASLETARSDPRVLYVASAMYDANQWRPALARSMDAGASWQSHELFDRAGGVVPYILSVDPGDPNRVFLRLKGLMSSDDFAIYDAGTDALTGMLALKSAMSAFLLRSDGALIIGAMTGGAWITTDLGASFAPWAETLHLRALAERDGRIYAGTNHLEDGFALAVSDDAGASWAPLLRFEQIAGPMQCGEVAEICAVPWETLLATLANPPVLEPGPDAGVPEAGAGGEGGAGGGVGGAGTRLQGGCSITESAPGGTALWLACLPLIWLWQRQRKMA
jgi:hypothetical protein